MSDSPELLKPDLEVTDKELQINLGNLKAENERLQTDYAKLLKSSTVVTNKLREEVREARSQLETERASREEIEAELSDLKQKSATASELSEKTLPDAATILSHLRGKRKKTPVTLADIEAILEMME